MALNYKVTVVGENLPKTGSGSSKVTMEADDFQYKDSAFWIVQGDTQFMVSWSNIDYVSITKTED